MLLWGVVRRALPPASCVRQVDNGYAGGVAVARAGSAAVAAAVVMAKSTRVRRLHPTVMGARRPYPPVLRGAPGRSPRAFGFSRPRVAAVADEEAGEEAEAMETAVMMVSPPRGRVLSRRGNSPVAALAAQVDSLLRVPRSRLTIARQLRRSHVRGAVAIHAFSGRAPLLLPNPLGLRVPSQRSTGAFLHAYQQRADGGVLIDESSTGWARLAAAPTSQRRSSSLPTAQRQRPQHAPRPWHAMRSVQRAF